MKNECVFGENDRFSYVSPGLVLNKPRAYMKQAEMLRGQIQGIVELSTGEDDSNESDQQTIEETKEVLLRRLPERMDIDPGVFELVSMDLLCEVREGERLEQMTVFFNTNMLQVHN